MTSVRVLLMVVLASASLRAGSSPLPEEFDLQTSFGTTGLLTEDTYLKEVLVAGHYYVTSHYALGLSLARHSGKACDQNTRLNTSLCYDYLNYEFGVQGLVLEPLTDRLGFYGKVRVAPYSIGSWEVEGQENPRSPNAQDEPTRITSRVHSRTGTIALGGGLRYDVLANMSAFIESEFFHRQQKIERRSTSVERRSRKGRIYHSESHVSTEKNLSGGNTSGVGMRLGLSIAL